MVAGEDAEAAGVDRQDLGQPELGREVGDALARARRAPGPPGGRGSARPPRRAVRITRGALPGRSGPRRHARAARPRPRGTAARGCRARASRPPGRAPRRARGSRRATSTAGRGRGRRAEAASRGRRRPGAAFSRTGVTSDMSLTEPLRALTAWLKRLRLRRAGAGSTRTESFSPSARNRSTQRHASSRPVSQARRLSGRELSRISVVGVLDLPEVHLEGQRLASATIALERVERSRGRRGRARSALASRSTVCSTARPRPSSCSAIPASPRLLEHGREPRGVGLRLLELVADGRSRARAPRRSAKPRGGGIPWPARKRMQRRVLLVERRGRRRRPRRAPSAGYREDLLLLVAEEEAQRVDAPSRTGGPRGAGSRSGPRCGTAPRGPPRAPRTRSGSGIDDQPPERLWSPEVQHAEGARARLLGDRRRDPRRARARAARGRSSEAVRPRARRDSSRPGDASSYSLKSELTA